MSYDDGKTWSEINSYKTAKENEFKFGFTSDPQIKENGESNKEGWNSSDGTNQTGWATMLDKLMQENVKSGCIWPEIRWKIKVGEVK